MGAALALPFAWFVVHFGRLATTPLEIALWSGSGIFGAAFLLSWTCEVAQLDITRALALALLALIAVLPEYAVDVYFAWRAGQDPTYTAYATANMTGGNRLLIGVGWATAVLALWLRYRARDPLLLRDPGQGHALALRHGRPLLDVRGLRARGQQDSPRGAGAGGAGGAAGAPRARRAAGRDRGARPARRRRHRDRGGALRGEPDRHRAAIRHRGVPPRAVAGAARLRVARVRGGGAVRATRLGRRQHRDAHLLDREPVDAARGRAARGLRALARERRPHAARWTAARGDLPHLGAVGVRAGGDRELHLLAPRGPGAVRALRAAALPDHDRGALDACHTVPRPGRRHRVLQPDVARGRAAAAAAAAPAPVVAEGVRRSRARRPLGVTRDCGPRERGRRPGS